MLNEQEYIEQLKEAVIDGDDQDVVEIAKEALEAGVDPQVLLTQGLMAGADIVGQKFESGEFFLPQLMLTGRALKAAMSVLEPALQASLGDKAGEGDTGTVVICTVQTDIHDIGKNIVALMLKNHGFEVIDLGKDVSDEEIVEAALRHKPNIVGLSALMTTTMAHMEGVIRKAREAGVTCPFLVGGAVVTRAFARAIGAHYAADGVEAVKVAGSLLPSE